jgi:serine/threonine protein kinase
MTVARSLTGLTLDNGWTVIGLVGRLPNATGGFFSVGYHVVRADGKTAFLKAMDYSGAFQIPVRTADLLHAFTQMYRFERDLCLKCRDEGLSRVVHAIDSGSIRVIPNDPYSVVEYLIFEKAEGDIRAFLDAQADLDIAFAFRALHHIAVGLHQLHGVNVAHQDLKPSNVLLFGNDGSKVADLGRAWAKGIPSPHDDAECPGDLHYGPPELLYGAVPTDERARRFGPDLYHLGSMAVFIFLRTHLNALIDMQLDREHHHTRWGGTYAAVLPYVQAAFAKALATFRAQLPDRIRPTRLKDELTTILAQLCEPDLEHRGHPGNRGGPGNQYSLEKYISIFNRMAYAAEVQFRSGVA